MILFFDTETTGKADFKSPADAKHQPRMVQIAAILLSNDGAREIAHLNCLIKPDGFEIPAEVTAIHGITTLEASSNGIPVMDALTMFYAMAKAADVLVAYNSDFDTLVLKSELLRGKNPWMISAFEEPRRIHCAMKACTNICQIPGPYGFKWPKLQESYRHFFDADFEDAHDALADVRATIKVHFATEKLILKTQSPAPQ